jgi:hypothetical protein
VAQGGSDLVQQVAAWCSMERRGSVRCRIGRHCMQGKAGLSSVQHDSVRRG